MSISTTSKRVFVWTFLVILASLCVLCSFFAFARFHLEPPRGCDQFGYMYQAQAIREGRLFSSHTDRPFLKPLVEKLSSDNSNPDDYRWMIAPHAYHYIPKAGKIINQYPPGTAIGLSLFPARICGLVYPVLITLSMTLLLALLIKEEPERILIYGSAILFFAALQLLFPPFSNEYRSVGSVAPTFALIFAAGWFVRKSPLLSIALVSSTVILRIANAWLLPVFILAYVFRESFSGEKFPTLRVIVVRSVKSLAVAAICGVAWIPLYQWTLLGNPFSPTYSEMDRNFTTWSDVAANCRFYFCGANGWFVVNAIAVALTCALYFHHSRRRWIAWAILLVAWNYAFFLTHKVAISYYPYASAVAIVGLVVSGLEVVGGKTRAALSAAAIVGIAIVLLFAWRMPVKGFSHNYAKEKAAYRQSFGRADVVWGDSSTGTVEYTTRKAGFRFFWGSSRARLETMIFLRESGYVQAVYLDDGGMKPDEALAVLMESGLPFTVVTMPRFGRVAWIFADAKK